MIEDVKALEQDLETLDHFVVKLKRNESGLKEALLEANVQIAVQEKIIRKAEALYNTSSRIQRMSPTGVMAKLKRFISPSLKSAAAKVNSSLAKNSSSNNKIGLESSKDSPAKINVSGSLRPRLVSPVNATSLRSKIGEQEATIRILEDRLLSLKNSEISR